MAAEAAGAAAVSPAMRRDLRRVRVLRFAVGATLASAIAYAYEWPLFYLTPVLAISFLSHPLPALGRKVVPMILSVLAAVLLGMTYSLFLQPLPLVYIPLLGLTIFHIYYFMNRRGPFFVALMTLLSVLILPLAGVVDELLVLWGGAYFAFSVAVAILACMLVGELFPDPPGAPQPAKAAFQPGYVAAAAEAALRSTLVVLPIAVLFMALQLYSQILVLVFAAMLSFVPQAAKGWAGGIKLLISTLIGCAAAVVVYWLLVAVPEYHFFLVLWFLAMTAFAGIIFSEHPMAGYMGSAATAMTVLVSGSLGANADFFDNVVIRVVLIAMATLYVAAALTVIDRFLFRRTA
ncbi:MAG TPA: DUF2955 domain-containing protein [Kiloniellaceae bacterium]|nr:DUF2955 domain-containing protein [Kiloniellaceae bacterium]